MDDLGYGDLDNVIRFPVELRVPPSMALVGELEPDVREITVAGDILGLDLPPADLFGRVDAETARYIAEQVLPLTPDKQRGRLDEVLRPVLGAAVAACRKAELASRRSAEAARELLEAQSAGGHWMEPLEETADALLHEAAVSMIEAHCRCQEARGVSRAVGMARRGEAWLAYDAAETSSWLAETGAAVRAGGAAGQA